MSRFELIPKVQQKNHKELERISKVVSAFDFSALVDVICVKEEFEEDVANDAIIELSRFLTLKALDLDLDATKLSPSGLVDKAWHCLLQLPVLYYKFCDKILPSKVKAPRIIDHNPLGAEDEDRDDRYTHTLQRYKEVFGIEPPSFFWEDDEEEPGNDEEEDVNDVEDEEEEGTDANVRKRARLDESDEAFEIPVHEPYCNCEYDPQNVLDSNTGYIEGVTSQIYVKHLTGDRTRYNVNLSHCTVEEFKAQIHSKEGLPCQNQRLIYEGRQLDDGRTLSYYNLQNMSTVHVVLRMVGC